MYKDLTKLEWEEKFSVGVKELDAQHKKIFEVINQLVTMLTDSPDPQEIKTIIESIRDYKENHFATEEAMFVKCGYEGAAEHIETHRKFSRDVEELMKRNEGNLIKLAYELTDFLEDWLLDHILNMDQLYEDCLSKNK